MGLLRYDLVLQCAHDCFKKILSWTALKFKDARETERTSVDIRSHRHACRVKVIRCVSSPAAPRLLPRALIGLTETLERKSMCSTTFFIKSSAVGCEKQRALMYLDLPSLKHVGLLWSRVK